MVERGADAVIVQHPHCLGGYEEYEGGHIVYGQGALIMDEAVYRRVGTFHEGYLVRLSISEDTRSTMTLVPYVQSNPVPGARRMGAERERQFRQALAEKSKALTDDSLVEAQWLRFCEAARHQYLSALLGHNRILRKLNTHGLLERCLYSGRQLLGVRNLVCCETHREVLETIFTRRLL
jgi:poly-gamma-glutamate synthesis protein (capsule biosynthesis protein)